MNNINNMGLKFEIRRPNAEWKSELPNVKQRSKASIARVFSFDGFDIELSKNRIVFHYAVDDEIFFDPILELDLSKVKDGPAFKAAVFNLGMAEIPSFYKTVCTPIIMIKAGYLSDGQIIFWENLFKKGLGEFFYRNNIDFRNLAKIEVAKSCLPVAAMQGNLVQREVKNGREGGHSGKEKYNNYTDFPTGSAGGEKYLVPLGGGKDSVVTAEILKSKGLDFTWFMLEPWSACQRVIDVSGNSKKIEIGRDPKKYFSKVMELNRQGFYNGHVPISATYIFSAVLAAQIYGFTDIVFSSERSANIGNVEYLGVEINHQYSKSFEFEKACHDYIHEYISPNINMFSLLRNLYEIQIAKIFCTYPKYFAAFLSCNRGLKNDNGWCGKCAKCAFVFAMLSAFLEPGKVEGIFGGNLFEDEDLLLTFEELLGLKNIKPFDCVGTVEEVLLALYLAKKKYLHDVSQVGNDDNVKGSSGQLPFILQKLEVEGGEKYLDLLESNTNEHLIPNLLLAARGINLF